MFDALAYIAESQKIRQIHAYALAAGLWGFGGLVGYYWPDFGAARSYDLVQVDGAESDIIDYDQSATDCAVKIEALRNTGILAVCELAQ